MNSYHCNILGFTQIILKVRGTPNKKRSKRDIVIIIFLNVQDNWHILLCIVNSLNKLINIFVCSFSGIFLDALVNVSILFSTHVRVPRADLIYSHTNNKT